MPKRVGCGYVYFKNRFCGSVTVPSTSNPYKPTRPDQNFKSKTPRFFFFWILLRPFRKNSLTLSVISHFLWYLSLRSLTFSNLSQILNPSLLLADVAELGSVAALSLFTAVVALLALLPPFVQGWVSNSTLLMNPWSDLLKIYFETLIDGGLVKKKFCFLF